jgi:hypothetical protein
MQYAASTNGFYLPEVHGAAIPSDAVEISEQLYVDLIAGQAAGQIITADLDGTPMLKNPAPILPPTPDQIRAATSMSKADFCRALYSAKILTEDSVVEAALGRLPTEFASALAGLPAEARVEARIAWASAASVNRMAPLFLSLLDFYAKAKTMTDAQAQALGDTIFGISI